MVRSMVAAVAGLKTHQSKMDVIGNNIANVNTWGFKSYSFNFQDSMYANSINGSGGSTLAGAAGGRNASQVGYGSTLSSITNEFGTGAPSPSSNPLDCMIDGTGFFLVGNMVNGTFTNVTDSGLYLSRVGIFRVDNNGYLVDDQRSYVYGYALVDGTGTPEVPVTTAEYSVTGAQLYIGPDANGPIAEMQVGGVNITVPTTYTADQLANNPTAFEQVVNDLIKAALKDPAVSANCKAIRFDGAGTGISAANLAANLTLVAREQGTAGDAALAAMQVGGQSGVRTVEGVDWEPSTQAEYANELSAIQIPIDPRTGQQYEIQSYKINEDGTILGVDKENRAIAIGQIALVTVENPNDLEKTSGYYYTPGANAGDVGAMKPNGGPSGKIMGGYLEMANVDLANEFSNMITCQRGFQANSKIITVTDEMLAELVNMKR